MRVTIGISTWNRARLLDRTLMQMQKLRVPEGVQWEVIVVNNNSTDETDAVIASHKEKLPLRGFFEPRPGKSHACNLIVREASGELLLWTDDDVLVDERWMEQYVLAARQSPEASFFGGRINPFYETEPPRWVLNSLPLLAGPFALMQFEPEIRLLKSEEIPAGANMAMRTAVLRKHPFDSRIGPSGKRTLPGEDRTLILTLKSHGHLGLWVGTAKVRHWVPAKRMTHQYLHEWFYHAGIAAVCMDEIPGKRIFGMPRWVARQYLQHTLIWLCRPFISDAKYVTAVRGRAFNAGMLSELRRQHRLAAPTTARPVVQEVAS